MCGYCSTFRKLSVCYNTHVTYKALMLDVDGTLIPYDYAALPSKRVTAAIQEAQKHLHICLVTGRSFHSTVRILEALKLVDGYVVINNGAQVFDIARQTYVYEQAIEQEDVKRVIDLLTKERIPFYAKDDTYSQAETRRFYSPGQPLGNTYMFYTDDVLPEERADNLTGHLLQGSALTIHKTHHKNLAKFALNISHTMATKLHGIAIVQNLLGLTKEETIGIGDSYNDFPLLMACGLKVAMGNAVDDLKAIADIIAPPVTEDGVAVIIKQHILAGTIPTP